MDRQALEKLRDGTPECLSDLDLDHLASAELPPQTAASLQDHVSRCPSCQTSLAARRAKFGAFPGVDPRPMLAAIRARLQDDELARKRQGRRRRYAWISTPAFAAAAALAIFMMSRPREPEPIVGDGIREKGGLGLRVYKLAGNRSVRTASGDHFSAGDRLRFVVDLPGPGQVNILGVEQSGQLYVAWPSSESESSVRGAGKGQELPGAMALDNSTGQETLYLVHCPLTVGAPKSVCRSLSAPQPCPSGCVLTPFVLNKQQP